MRRGPPPWRREGGGKGPGQDAGKSAPGRGRRDDRPERFSQGRGQQGGAETPRPAGGDQRKPSVNLNSPFAKLLDLKPLLQARDKSR